MLMVVIAQLFDCFNESTQFGRQDYAAWRQSLSGRKLEFCQWLEKEGGRRGALRRGTIVSYVESLTACSGFVQGILHSNRDFYAMSDALEIERLQYILQHHEAYQLFVNTLAISPVTAINRYLDFVR